METVAYATSQGNNDLRDAVSAYYKSWDIPYERDDIYVTNGGSEALWFAVMTICDPGDELLVPEPFYGRRLALFFDGERKIRVESDAAPPVQGGERRMVSGPAGSRDSDGSNR